MQKKFMTVLAVATFSVAVSASAFAAMAASNTVNSAAIVDGSIATLDIANLAVTGAKIANGTITSTQLASGAVTATQLAAGAVTDAKISGIISSTKLPIGTTATTVAAGNHTHSSTIKYAQVVVVAKSGGDSTNPAAAVASITDASATKPYLVKVMPGIYDITTPVQMKPFVDLEGSGSDNTVIRSAIVNANFETCTAGTIIMANNTNLKNIKVVNTAPDLGANNLSAAVVFNNVTAKADGIYAYVGSDTANNINTRNNGICSVGTNGNAILNNVNLETHNSGNDAHSNPIIVLEDGSVTLTNSKLAAFTNNNGAIHALDCTQGINLTGKVDVINSVVEGTILNSIEGSNNSGLYFDDCIASASNTIVKLNGGFKLHGVEAQNTPYRLVNVQVFLNPSTGATEVYSVQNGGNGFGKIANSMITGGLNGFDAGAIANSKLFNNYDENLNLIPNN